MKISTKTHTMKNNGGGKTPKNTTRKKKHTSSKIDKSPLEFKKMSCAPGKDKNKYTCYTSASLEKMRILWNARHPDKPINATEPKKIWTFLKQHFDNVCSNEQCWLRQQFISNHLDQELMHHTFSPPAPKSWRVNPNEWLSSLDIIAVMKQFEKEYSCFDFIGPSPIDYDTHIQYGECVWKELCEFDLTQHIKNGKMKIGIIFNLDPHYKSGSHWVSLFVNIGKGEIYYFDSVGDAPDKQIVKLMNAITEQGKKVNIKFSQEINKKQHQFGDTECGMYSLYFIINMLRDISFKTFQNEHFTDELMTQFREKYFNVLD